ncbi:hypothetical protein OIU77_006492 [Salix suchowensis]|uniref:Seed biotin-containing protein SBP65 n=1 Tax=Salix suchowensis TaxID=1278906 RepID=A0ABQ9AL42_9ROSI|nr:hypothetical protein OIU77_006492 [Salix suchowensis]
MAAENAAQARDITAQKTAQGKDTVVEGAQKTTSYIAEKGAQAKDTIVEGARRTSEPLLLDGLLLITQLKKAVDGTVAAARAVEYAGQKTTELAGKPLRAAKETAASTGESIKEYTARKKEEAERELEARKAAEGQRSFQGGEYKEESQVHATGGQGAEVANQFSEEITPEGEEQYWRQQQGQEASSLLGAIGETIVEIAQATKDLVIGQDPAGAGKKDGYEASQFDYAKQEKNITEENKKRSF